MPLVWMRVIASLHLALHDGLLHRLSPPLLLRLLLPVQGPFRLQRAQTRPLPTLAAFMASYLRTWFLVRSSTVVQPLRPLPQQVRFQTDHRGRSTHSTSTPTASRARVRLSPHSCHAFRSTSAHGVSQCPISDHICLASPFSLLSLLHPPAASYSCSPHFRSPCPSTSPASRSPRSRTSP